ncbi:MAG: hypothetical protein K0V04_45705 [Deltaproteobacteria bacterium]|nr:hypothetical protein [Deltaproteobacteria bacterium]
MRRSFPLFVSLLVSIACAAEADPEDLETRDAALVELDDAAAATADTPSALVDEAADPTAIPWPIGPNCNGIPVAKCDDQPGCTVDAIGCDPPLCEIDPYTGEEVCYPCDPVLVCVAEDVQCFGLSVGQCLNYPDDCQIDVFGCDNVPICEIGPFGGEEICYGCDPVAICVDKKPSPVALP